jgi:hypothetical protein
MLFGVPEAPVNIAHSQKKLMIGKLGRPGLFRVKRVILTVRVTSGLPR